MQFKNLLLISVLLSSFFAQNTFAQKDSETEILDTILADDMNISLNSNREFSCWGSKKVDSMTNNGEDRNISNRDFAQLDALQHFVYAFNYPESYHQSCTFFIDPIFSENEIPSELRFDGEGYRMSIRQASAILGNRDSTSILMQACILKQGSVQNVFKKAIVNYQFCELIPALISTYLQQQNKDNYILTTLCQMMRNAGYKEFLNSPINTTLYEKVADKPFSEKIKHSIPNSKKNNAAILKMAHNYYEWEKTLENKFVQITQGEYTIGEENHPINPVRKVTLPAFEISKYEVTNAEFMAFVKATGYVTDAEKKHNASVFRVGLDEFEWINDSSANWRFPNGLTKGGILDKMNHPVTCISYADAEAYCNWADVHLPTFEQWEVAARGGSNSVFFFGNDSTKIHEYANIWKGKNHFNASPNDSFQLTAPVGSYIPNPYALFDIYGNVFEFCSNKPNAFNQFEDIVVTRGGSWWCSTNSCNYFNSVDIGRVNRHASFSNNGFRVVH